MDFKGQAVFISGGTSGIGRDAALAFGRAGARVVVTGRSVERGEKVVGELQALGAEAFFISHDVTSEPSWVAAMAEARERYGSLDVLVNNAGIFTIGAIENTELADFQQLWRTNVDGVFLGMKYAMPLLREGSGCGAIVNISSLSGLVGHPDCVSYCTSKAASIMLTRVMALEAGPAVRVNALAPGPVWNELLERAHSGQDLEAMKDYYRQTQPLKFLGDSSDVTEGILFLASEDARYITGTAFRIDAGRGAD